MPDGCMVRQVVCGCAALKHINVTMFAKRGIPTHDWTAEVPLSWGLVPAMLTRDNQTMGNNQNASDKGAR